MSVRTYPKTVRFRMFRDRFTTAGTCTEFVSVHTESADAKRQFDGLFSEIVTDRHEADRS